MKYRYIMMGRIFVIASSALLACAAGGDNAKTITGTTSHGGTGGTAAAVGGQGGAPSDGGFTFGGGNTGDFPTLVYGHTRDTLFSLDPVSHKVTEIGKFSGCAGNGVLDIAIDKDEKIVGSTQIGLYAIDSNTAACTLIKTDSSFPNSLSFVPAGTVDPTSEALVGYRGGTYVRIDTKTGVMSDMENIGNGFVSSGDIVSVKNGGTYLTVTHSSSSTGCKANDCLLEVSPSTGEMVKNWGSIGHNRVFGLAFWGGSVFGFSDAGKLFEVLFDGNALKVSTIQIPNPPPNLAFWGAGSSTVVPVNVPQ